MDGVLLLYQHYHERIWRETSELTALQKSVRGQHASRQAVGLGASPGWTAVQNWRETGQCHSQDHDSITFLKWAGTLMRKTHAAEQDCATEKSPFRSETLQKRSQAVALLAIPCLLTAMTS